MITVKKLLYHDCQEDDLFDWAKTKRRWAKTLGKIPRNSEIYLAYLELLKEGKLKADIKFENTLRIRGVRTLSGVAPFAVMMGPFPCPGQCIYCIQSPGMPKSYMDDEPAAARAKKLDFDPYQQVRSRLEQMEITGHQPRKLQIIVIGGTFSAYPKEYASQFIKSIYDACNGVISADIDQAIILNQSATYRVVGMSIETRPDWVTPKEIQFLRQHGVTKVQLGVQSLDEKVLKKIRRGHGIEEIVKATQLLRNAGFKINYHMMPNLPLSSPKSEIKQYQKLFTDQRFCPDTLKIYPTIVLPQTELFNMWQRGEYKPWDDETMIKTLAKIKTHIPKYCRIDRLVRDITRKWTMAGTLKTNMRDVVGRYMTENNMQCQCIRCREIKGHITLNDMVKPKQLIYKSNNGEEYFLTYEDKKYLHALLRLRLIAKKDQLNNLFPVLKDAALIREIQVFGKQMPLNETLDTASQHKHMGRKLISIAEKIAGEKGYKRIAIISGVGVRAYYQKLGYHLEDTYMVKDLVDEV